LANTASGAFATIQHAINVVCRDYESGVYSITIQIQDGTWPHANTVTLNPHLIAGGVVLQGNPANPLACIIQKSSAGWLFFFARGGGLGHWTLNGLNMGRSATGFDVNTVLVGDTVLLHIQNCNFGNAGPGGSHLYATNLAQIKTTGPISISGGAYRHAIADRGSIIDLIGAYTLTGTPVFTHWVEGYRGSKLIHQNSAVVSGASTVSLRYYLQWQSMAEGIGNMPGAGGSSDATSIAF
ncbi:MAG TPA: hypothetical protein PK954_23045, partial [Anaerolineales bacterium]|nr:hypothetical protein [Anaerolineales bacterium]